MDIHDLWSQHLHVEPDGRGYVDCQLLDIISGTFLPNKLIRINRLLEEYSAGYIIDSWRAYHEEAEGRANDLESVYVAVSPYSISQLYLISNIAM